MPTPAAPVAWMTLVLLIVALPARSMPKPRPEIPPVLEVRLRVSAVTAVLPAAVPDIVAALSRVSELAPMAPPVPEMLAPARLCTVASPPEMAAPPEMAPELLKMAPLSYVKPKIVPATLAPT